MSGIKALAIIGLFLYVFPTQPLSSAWAEDLETEIAARERASYELRQKIEQYNETAGKKSRQAKNLQARIADLRKNSELAGQQLKLLELQSGNLEKSIGDLDGEIAGIAGQAAALADELRLRVVNIYKYGTREELNLLLSAESAHEAVASAYLLERLARHDRMAIEGLLNKMEELGRGKRGIERNKAQLVAMTGELNLRREEYNAVIDKTSAALSGVQRERRKAEAAIKETEQAQLELERAIAALVRRKSQRPQDGPAASNATVYPVLGQGSLLDWPVRGPVAVKYGPRVHPVFKTKSFNSGIDISAQPGAPVQAAGPGEVLYEGWLRGFGQVVIIGHGRGISTVYAHLASARVKEGDSVMPGTLIGTVGGGEASEGHSLHFEVRIGDAAKDPLNYLKRT